jgi:uncharacterized protein (DUF2267 family)
VSGLDTEQAARAVLRVIEKRIAPGEVEDVRAAMPKELRTLWQP